MILTLFFISVCGGFLSGFLGIGGALVIIPLMLTVPPIIGVGVLSVKIVSSLSIIQVFFASLSGVIIHKKNSFVHFGILFFVGVPLGISALIASYFSKYFHNNIILIIFALMVFITILTLYLGEIINKKNSKLESNENLDIKTINPNKKLLLFLGFFTGALSGTVGSGGGFILIPLMINFLKIPLKIVVGTTLGITFIGSLFGSIGKLASMEFDYKFIIPVVIGSILASRFGAKLNKKTAPIVISYTLQAVLIVSFIQILVKILK